MIQIKSQEEIARMRESGRIAAAALDMLSEYIKPGITTEEINELCFDFALSHDCYPSPLFYGKNPPFPKSLCTSINEVICHGIPSKKRKLQDGDIVNLDVTVYKGDFTAEDIRKHLSRKKSDYFPYAHRGYHGDTNRTFIVGDAPDEVKKLVEVTYECMMRGIQTVKPGSRLGDIGHAIQSHAEAHGYSVVRDFTGHGIGRGFHEDPQVRHYGLANTGAMLRKGMTFTVEPMINMGTYHSELLGDGWTAVTRDGSLSAQFEHTLLVTDDGFEIFTLSPATGK
jgi:methionyl aminopeptidase